MQTKQIHVDKIDACRQNRYMQRKQIYMQTKQIHVGKKDRCRQNRYMQTKQIYVDNTDTCRQKDDLADYIAMFCTPM